MWKADQDGDDSIFAALGCRNGRELVNGHTISIWLNWLNPVYMNTRSASVKNGLL